MRVIARERKRERKRERSALFLHFLSLFSLVFKCPPANGIRREKERKREKERETEKRERIASVSSVR